MSKAQIISKAKNIIKQKRQKAESDSAKVFDDAMQNVSFATNAKNITNLEIEIAKKEFSNQDTSAESELLDVLKKERKSILKKLGLKEEDFLPKYSCKKCNDTGIYKDKFCNCLNQEINNLLTQDLGLNIDKSHTFKSCDKKFLEENGLSESYNNMSKWVEKFPTSKYKNFVFVGPAGGGKTYLTECIANALIEKQIVVNFVTAFNLNNLMLKYHTTFDETKNNILEGYINCPLLIIDDLGTEPILKNVTKEYLYLILNERIINDRCTIVTTNLSPDGLIDRYNERIFSRLFNKQNSLKINFSNQDLRLKK